MQSFRELVSVMSKDAERHAPCGDWHAFMRLMIVRPAFVCTCILRAMQYAHVNDHPFIAAMLRWFNLVVFSADFVPGCVAGPGLLLLHTPGIVMGSGVSVGANCTILHGTTLGERRVDGTGDHNCPMIGDRVTIGAGATVLGGARIEAGTVVRAGSLVIGD